MDFKELAEERRKVREFCQKHLSSLAAFKYKLGPSFALHWDPPSNAGKLRHLTTTATCIESLKDCHSTFRSERALTDLSEPVSVKPDEVVEGLVRVS